MLSDEYFMSHAAANATAAFLDGFSPVGAVLVDADTGEMLVSTRSQRKPGNILHAEFLAMLEYTRNGDSINPAGRRRDNLTLYTTMEPCIMCLGMAIVLRIKRVVWLVDDHWGGAHEVYNQDSLYAKKRFPKFERLDTAPLHKQNCIQYWVEYLRRDPNDHKYIPLLLGDQYADQGVGKDD